MMVLPDDVLGNAAVRETNGKAAAMRRFANAKVSSRLRCHRRRKPTGRCRQPAAAEKSC